MTIDNVIARLEKVKRTGRDSYMACCPCHGDKHPSLSIKYLSDGRVLIHCFAGCDVYSVLSSIGLEMSDLFPQQAISHAKPQKHFPASDALQAIGFECLVVAASASKLLGVEKFTDADRERLITSISRIHAAINAVECHYGRS